VAGVADRTLTRVVIVRQAVGHRATAGFAMLDKRAVQHGVRPYEL
jgi:hypothetical protein